MIDVAFVFLRRREADLLSEVRTEINHVYSYKTMVVSCSSPAPCEGKALVFDCALCISSLWQNLMQVWLG